MVGGTGNGPFNWRRRRPLLGSCSLPEDYDSPESSGRTPGGGRSCSSVVSKGFPILAEVIG